MKVKKIEIYITTEDSLIGIESDNVMGLEITNDTNSIKGGCGSLAVFTSSKPEMTFSFKTDEFKIEKASLKK